MKSILSLAAALAIAFSLLLLGGCATTPKSEDREAFIAESRSAVRWFERRTPGLEAQIRSSAGYVVYPEVGQWGILFGGGQFGRGLVCKPDGTQIGWGAINTGSIGLQAGVRGFKMLAIFQDQTTLERFKDNRLSGSVTGVIVVAEEGASTTAKFENGVAVYQGASTGLMAGVNIGLDYLRFKPLNGD